MYLFKPKKCKNFSTFALKLESTDNRLLWVVIINEKLTNSHYKWTNLIKIENSKLAKRVQKNDTSHWIIFLSI